MPHGPSSVSVNIKKRRFELQRLKLLSKSLTHAGRKEKVESNVASLLKPHDLLPLKEPGPLGDITVVFQAQQGELRLTLGEICGR